MTFKVLTLPSSSNQAGGGGGNGGGGFQSALKIQKGDITHWFVDGSSDAIVNPANVTLLGGGGADGAIHEGGVIHTVGPIYYKNSNPEASLRNAYKNSLSVAKKNNIQYIAFPAISCGLYGYPYEEAAAVALSTVKEFADGFKEVHFVLFTDVIYNVWLNKEKELFQA
ncbi:hypothetical protein ACOSP7_004097 [Xanthoceras sorbifolium]